MVGGPFEPMIVGLALPFRVDRRTPIDGKWRTQYYERGCAARAIRGGQIELWVEQEFRESLVVDQRHGRLHVWEGPAGVWFTARLPLTTGGRALYGSLVARPLNVCCGGGTVSEAPDMAGRVMVWDFDFRYISLEREGGGCFPQTWVAALNERALQRMYREDMAALARQDDSRRHVGQADRQTQGNVVEYASESPSA